MNANHSSLGQQKHYNHVHSDLTVACEKFHAVNIQRYVQFYQSPEMKKKVQELGMEVKLPIYMCVTFRTYPNFTATGLRRVQPNLGEELGRLGAVCE